MSHRTTTSGYEVRTSDDHVIQWDRENIIQQILRDTSLCQKFYGHPPATREIAEHIAIDVEQKLAALDTSYLTSHLIRELVCISLLEHGYHAYRNMCTRVGTPVYDAHMIDIGGGFESNDNANLQGNPETSHKKKADKISKEQYLLQLPPHIAEAHLRSDIHIHDLEYFGTRPFCMAKDTVVIVQAPDTTLTFGTVGAIFGDFAFAQGAGCDLADGAGYRVLTPTGFVPITSISRRRATTMCRVTTASGMFADLTPDHRVILRNPDGGFRRVKVADLTDGDAIGRIEFAPSALTRRPTTTEIHGVTITPEIALLIGRYCRGQDEMLATEILDTLRVSREAPDARYLPDWLLQVSDDLIQCVLHGMEIDLMHDKNLIEKITAIPSPILRQQVRCLIESLPLCDWDCAPIIGRIARVQQIDAVVYDDYVYDFALTDIHMFYAGSGLLVSNCQDWDLRYFFYYGLIPDGRGTKASVSAPANRPEVAVLHAVKVLGSAQTNFAGGQGYYNFLTFLAPYLEGLTYNEIKQLMQMFVYEMTQMMVARGGQSLSKDELIVVRHADTGEISIRPIGEFCHTYVPGEGTHILHDTSLETLSLNKQTGSLEWKPITGVYVHKPASPLKRVTVWSGRDVVVTSDHSLFTLDEHANFVETTAASNPNTILCTTHLPVDEVTHHYTPDDAWAFGAMIGDGNVVYLHDRITGISISPSNEAVSDRFVDYLKTKTTHTIQYTRPSDESAIYHISVADRSLGEYFARICRGAANKQIPDDMLGESETVLWSLLDGLLSTDGNTARRRYEYSTTSVKLARQIEFILMRLGVTYAIRTRNSKSNFTRNHPVYCIQINAQDSANINIVHSERQFEPSGDSVSQNNHDFAVLKPFIKAKYGRGVSALNYAYKATDRKLKYEQLMLVNDKLPELCNKMRNILPMEVKSIEDVPDEEFVYDIGVQDNENFVLHNGIVAHNTVFASVQLSPGVPTLWKDKPVVYKGRVWDGKQAPHRTYGEFEREVRLSFKALMDVMLDGDYWGKPFNFPKPEVSLEPDFMTEDEAYNADHPDLPSYRDLYDMAFELAAKFGTPYFDNQIPAYRGAGKGISCYQCCMPGFTRIPVMTKFGIRIIRLDQLEKGYQVMTPDGFKGFEDILVRDFKGDLIRIKFANGRFFLCTDDHRIPVIRNKRLTVIPASEVVVGDAIPYRPVNTDEVADAYPYEKTVTVTKLGQEPFCGKVYDPINVEGHLFYTADGLLTSNCAYQFGASPESDPEFFDKLYFRNGAHFSMGAGQVVTLNCPRAAYESGNDVKKLVARLKGLMDIAAEIFVIKQRWMREIVTHNRIPFALQRPRDPITGELGAVAVDLPGLVYTVGIVGINEMVQHLTGSQLYESKDAVKTAVYVLVELNKYARELTERHGFTIAMARTPAETTGQRFAVADLLSDRYRADARTVVKGELETFDRDVGTTRDLPVYYNNGTHIPVDAPISIYDKIRVEEIFFTLVQGGNIFHAFLGETMPDPHGLAEFGLNIAKNTQIGYFAFTRDLTIPLRRYRWYAEPA